MNRTRIYILLLAAVSCRAAAEEPAVLTLEGCREAAVVHSPLTDRQALAGEKRQAKDRVASAALLPQLEVNAQASYQNKTVNFPGDLPVPITLDLPRDQYKATVDLNQVIYGGGSVRNAKRNNEAAEQVETASLAVQIDRLRDRVDEAYLRILLTDRQLKVNGLMQQTLAADMKTVEARIANGTATGGAQAALTARLLELQQQQTELHGTRRQAIETLSVLTGLPVTEETVLQVPAVPVEEPAEAGTGNETFAGRTELQLYARQREQLDVQDKLLNSQSLPKISLFASGGYGRPGYNFLDRDFDLMAIGGLRLHVPLTAWAETQRGKRANRIAQLDLAQQQRDFEQNASIEVAQYRTEIEQLRRITAMDTQIVAARTAVRERALAQFNGGMITYSEYLTEFNNETAARIQAETNALRLVRAWIGYEAARGIYER